MADPRALLITGAAGFVGAALAVELLRARRSDLALCLVRAGSDAEARRRLEGALRDAGTAYAVPPDEIADVVARAVAVRGDLTAPGLGLDAAAAHRLRKAGPLHPRVPPRRRPALRQPAPRRGADRRRADRADDRAHRRVREVARG